MRKLAALGAALVLGLSGAALLAQPASAAPYITVCNHSSSADNINAYNNSVFKEYNINQGSCVSVDNYGGNARVDVDPAGGEADIESYKHKRNSESYSSCFNSENGASNPYNGATTTYRTYAHPNC